MRDRRGRDGSLIYNFLCNQCLSPVCQWLATGRWFSTGPPVSSTNKIDRHDIPEILLKVALNTIKQTHKSQSLWLIFFSTVVGSRGGGVFFLHTFYLNITRSHVLLIKSSIFHKQNVIYNSWTDPCPRNLTLVV
jgi:hypothetical protein